MTLNKVFGVNVQTEMFHMFGRQLEIKKAALQARYAVAWVLNDQSSGCMSCDKKFGMLRWKHHCRQCGHLVCHSCSPNVTEIPELNETKGSRTCKSCVSAKTGSFMTIPMKKAPSSPSTDSVVTDNESLGSKESI